MLIFRPLILTLPILLSATGQPAQATSPAWQPTATTEADEDHGSSNDWQAEPPPKAQPLPPTTKPVEPPPQPNNKTPNANLQIQFPLPQIPYPQIPVPAYRPPTDPVPYPQAQPHRSNREEGSESGESNEGYEPNEGGHR